MARPKKSKQVTQYGVLIGKDNEPKYFQLFDTVEACAANGEHDGATVYEFVGKVVGTLQTKTYIEPKKQTRKAYKPRAKKGTVTK